jgi:hypothetical protein
MNCQGKWIAKENELPRKMNCQEIKEFESTKLIGVVMDNDQNVKVTTVTEVIFCHP